MTEMVELECQFLYWLQGLHTPFLDMLLPFLSFLGNGGWFFVLLGAALFCVKRTRPAGAAILLSLLLGFIVGNSLLKNLFMRERPCWIDRTVPLLIQSPKDYSFPSGHSMASFETAISVWYYHRRWGAVLLVLASLIAFSRLYLFVHFPSDVACGIALGLFNGWLVHRALERRGK